MNADENEEGGLTRREALAVAGAVAAALPGCEAPPRSEPAPSGARVRSAHARMPVVFLPHGGGPWPFVELGFGTPAEDRALRAYLEGLPAVTPSRPRALLVVSAHWEEPVPTVMTAVRPPLLYDYYGFPEESYRVTWPAPGAPEVAARVRELLRAAGIASAEDARRGFDHGVFVPMKLGYPEAAMPTLQLSLQAGLDPAVHLAIGQALAPLRDEGVFMVGSGMSYHNLRGFRGAGRAVSEVFDAWLRESATLPSPLRAARLRQWATAPEARAAHPREEHLLPLMVVAGAAGEDPGRVAYNGTYAGVRLSAFHYG